MAPALIGLAACSGGGGDAAKGKGKGGQPGQGTPTVGYVVIQPSSVAMTTELSGRTTAFESSDVRPQVTGIIRRRFFTEGTLVKKGQPLYEIDPRLYRAAANEAQANLQSARANAEAQGILAQRYKRSASRITPTRSRPRARRPPRSHRPAPRSRPRRST
jgi:membrane fusion protein (multidrug efflux system)